jgi:hypothetical protein
MLQFRGPDDRLPAFEIRHESNACRFAAWIDLEGRGLRRAAGPTLQDDRKRIAPEHRRLALPEQLFCSRRTAGHERFTLTIQNQNALHERS